MVPLGLQLPPEKVVAVEGLTTEPDIVGPLQAPVPFRSRSAVQQSWKI